MAEALFPTTFHPSGGMTAPLAASLIAELQDLRLELADKASKLKDVEAHAAKLEAAVEHRDAVIAQLASSRKLVFEECHRACVSNQAELRQMQDALHRVSRQLQRERREHSARMKEVHRGGATGSPLAPGPKGAPAASLPWDDDEVLVSDDDLDTATGLALDEGVDDVAPGTPTRCLAADPAPAHSPCGSPSGGYSPSEELDFLTW